MGIITHGERSACPCPPGWIHGQPRNSGPAGQHVVGLSGETLQHTASGTLVRSILYQYGLTSSQPGGGVKMASRRVVWTVTLGLNRFPVMTFVTFRIRRLQQEEDTAKKKRKRLDFPSGETAKGRPSHIGRPILGRSTCFTNNVLQHVVGHTRHRHTKRNAARVVVSNWGKLENWHSNSIPANTSSTWAQKSMVGTTCVPSVSCSGKFSCNFAAKSFQKRCKTSTDHSPFWCPGLTNKNCTRGDTKRTVGHHP